MNESTLEAFICRYIAAQPVSAREINFVWQGGEPLLAGIGFYKKVIALQQRYAPDGVTISNSLPGRLPRTYQQCRLQPTL